ncbi:DUF58 domain-containing protein [bacterium]|nr:MAG: DUF58 domain-containing protein [bacterium]
MTFTPRTIFLLIFFSLLTVSGFAIDELLYIGIVAALLLFAAICFEFWFMPNQDQIIVWRKVASKLALGVENSVKIYVENRSVSELKMMIHDEPPDEFAMRSVNFEATLRPREIRSFYYEIHPNHRGDFVFHNVNLSCYGILFGLIQKRYIFSLLMPVKVYPNFKAIKKFELTALRGKWMQSGTRPVRQFGQGTEYESLREYSPDDEYRNINWNASARMAKLITTQYQVERSQNVMILIDAGRLMGGVSMGLSKLDHAINAALVLSDIAIKKNDNVGILVFSKTVQSFLAPKKTRTQLSFIAERLYNVKSELVESDYASAFEYLRQKHKRRSLIVMFTEFLDRYSSQILIHNVSVMYPKHLPLCVLMKDHSLNMIVNQAIESKDDVYQKAAAAELLEEREQAIAFVRSHGAIVLDVLPENLSSEVINKYIEIKNKNRL